MNDSKIYLLNLSNEKLIKMKIQSVSKMIQTVFL